jgi:hypothetical protein
MADTSIAFIAEMGVNPAGSGVPSKTHKVGVGVRVGVRVAVGIAVEVLVGVNVAVGLGGFIGV